MVKNIRILFLGVVHLGTPFRESMARGSVFCPSPLIPLDGAKELYEC